MLRASIVTQSVILLVRWNGVLCGNQRHFKACLSSLPAPPRPDGVSLGRLMNIDMRGLS